MRSLIPAILLTAVVAGQKGGVYDLRLNNLNGTSRSADSRFTLDATVGEPAAGTPGAAGPFFVRGGFWAFQQLAPTAAAVRMGGRVQTVDGRGISGAVVTLTDLNGASTFVVTGTFGYFRFDGVQAGQTLILSVAHRRYSFTEPAITLDVADNVTDILFIAR